MWLSNVSGLGEVRCAQCGGQEHKSDELVNDPEGFQQRAKRGEYFLLFSVARSGNSELDKKVSSMLQVALCQERQKWRGFWKILHHGHPPRLVWKHLLTPRSEPDLDEYLSY